MPNIRIPTLINIENIVNVRLANIRWLRLRKIPRTIEIKIMMTPNIEVASAYIKRCINDKIEIINIKGIRVINTALLALVV